MGNGRFLFLVACAALPLAAPCEAASRRRTRPKPIVKKKTTNTPKPVRKTKPPARLPKGTAPRPNEVPRYLTPRPAYPQRPNIRTMRGTPENPRPRIPASFDEATVRRFISQIDGPHHASFLKYGYLGRRASQPFAIEDGYAVLKSAAAKEPKGSARWFLLQSVQGYAAFRLPEPLRDDGFAAYNAMFAEVPKATSGVRSNSTVLRAARRGVDDYVFSVQGRFKDLGLAGSDDARITLEAAWRAWAALQSVPQPVATKKPTSLARAPRNNDAKLWTRAIAQSETGATMQSLIETTLSATNTAKNYSVLVVAANLFAEDKPDRALELLQQAKPLVPKNDVDETARFYTQLVKLLAPEDETDVEKLNLAIAAQREKIAATKRGDAKLLELLLRANEATESKTVLETLKAPAADDREIVSAAVMLLTRANKSEKTNAEETAQHREQATALLNSYLASKRVRRIDEELGARLVLGQTLFAQGKLDEAKTALDVSQMKAPKSGAGKQTLFVVKQLSMRIDSVSKLQTGEIK